MTVYSWMALALSSDERVRNLVTRWPTAQALVDRFVAGETPDDALAAVAALAAEDVMATVDRLGEAVTERAEARANAEGYRHLLGLAAQQDQAAGLDVSVKLTALGQALPADGVAVAYDNVALICERAAAVGATVTLDMEDHTTTESTLVVHERLRRDYPDVGVAIQASLRRSEADCRTLAASGARVRLCKGAYLVPTTVGFGRRDEVRASYARCLGVLMLGTAYPMVATHDPELIELAGRLATHLGRLPAATAKSVPAVRPADASGAGAGRTAGGGAAVATVRRRAGADRESLTAQDRTQRCFEYQMLFGMRPDEQRRLVAGGARVRVYVPYGPRWYPYLTRRLAERPANLALLLRAVLDHQRAPRRRPPSEEAVRYSTSHSGA